jgi:hypothetical protein
MSKFIVKGKVSANKAFFEPKAQYTVEEFKAMFDIDSLKFVGNAIYADGKLIGGHSQYHEDDGSTILINEYEYTAENTEFHFVTFRRTTVEEY